MVIVCIWLNVKTIVALFVLLAIHAPAMHAQEFGAPSTRVKGAALVAVILDSQKFHETSVQVAGVMFWHPEGSFLFLTRESYTAFDTKSAIEIPSGEAGFPPGLSTSDIKKLNGEVVWVEGKVNAKSSVGASAAIAKITWLKKM